MVDGRSVALVDRDGSLVEVESMVGSSEIVLALGALLVPLGVLVYVRAVDGWMVGGSVSLFVVMGDLVGFRVGGKDAVAVGAVVPTA